MRAPSDASLLFEPHTLAVRSSAQAGRQEVADSVGIGPGHVYTFAPSIRAYPVEFAPICSS